MTAFAWNGPVRLCLLSAAILGLAIAAHAQAPGANVSSRAGQSTPAATSPAAAQTRAPSGPPPTGTMIQVMRGIMFPNANMVFNVQSIDPDAPKASYEPNIKDGFSWVNWGAGLYSNWELLEYASVALADTAPMLLVPRLCANGKAAPVAEADWIKYVEQMAEAGRVAFRAARARNRDAAIESTNDITDSCAACHRAYRDKYPNGDRMNLSLRCTPLSPAR